MWCYLTGVRAVPQMFLESLVLSPPVMDFTATSSNDFPFPLSAAHIAEHCGCTYLKNTPDEGDHGNKKKIISVISLLLERFTINQWASPDLFPPYAPVLSMKSVTNTPETEWGVQLVSSLGLAYKQCFIFLAFAPPQQWCISLKHPPHTRIRTYSVTTSDSIRPSDLRILPGLRCTGEDVGLKNGYRALLQHVIKVTSSFSPQAWHAASDMHIWIAGEDSFAHWLMFVAYQCYRHKQRTIGFLGRGSR